MIWAAVIGWPMKEMATQSSNWWEQTLTARDRYQYITGWTQGYGTRQAVVTFLKTWAKDKPVVVITDGGLGHAGGCNLGLSQRLAQCDTFISRRISKADSHR